MTPNPVQVPLWIDLSAVVVAAMGGAMVAVRSRFDLTGIVGLGILAGLGGGLIRDILLNELPVAMRYPWYIVAAVAASLLVALLSEQLDRRVSLMIIIDAGALGLYGVTGTNKALANGLGVWPALLLGLIAGTGGGVIRDVMTAKPPSIFVRGGELYATACLAGLLAYVIGWHLGVDETACAVLGASLTFTVRLLAWRFQWHLPGAVDAPTKLKERFGAVDSGDSND